MMFSSVPEQDLSDSVIGRIERSGTEAQWVAGQHNADQILFVCSLVGLGLGVNWVVCVYRKSPRYPSASQLNAHDAQDCMCIHTIS